METPPLRGRSLLRFVLNSPLLVASQALFFENFLAAAARAQASDEYTDDLIAASADAITAFDFRAVAQRNLLPAHYTYLSMGVDDEVTLESNREAFAKFQLRPRRLVDVRDLDTSTEIFGAKLSCPILLAPVGSQATYHSEGEIAVARAAKRKDHLQILSMGSSASLEEVIEAREAPVWYQLYAQRVWPVTRWFLRQAEAARCPAVVLTVDIVGL